MEGEIEVSGSKNAALPILASSLLFKEKIQIQNLPEIEDVQRINELLDAFNLTGKIDKGIANRLRASILLAGPALARFGQVEFSHPGGCLIGTPASPTSLGGRPIDLFLEGWKAMGAEVQLLGKAPEEYVVSAPRGLLGGDYTFKIPSVTGTEALMMSAVLAKGITVLKNAALEPEIKYLADFLNAGGARISGAGTPTIKIEGRPGELLKCNAPFAVPPDRIEAGSFAILGALYGKNLRIKNFVAEELSALLAVLSGAGAEYVLENNYLIFKKSSLGLLKAVDIKTREFPGFPTDLQAPFTTLLTQAEGQSLVHETIFEGRLNYIEDLNRMGAKITLCDPHRAIVQGPFKLTGRGLESPDIRAGLAFIIAGIIADGETNIGNIYQIDRGYERVDERLRAIGADIKRVE